MARQSSSQSRNLPLPAVGSRGPPSEDLAKEWGSYRSYMDRKWMDYNQTEFRSRVTYALARENMKEIHQWETEAAHYRRELDGVYARLHRMDRVIRHLARELETYKSARAYYSQRNLNNRSRSRGNY
ncbi:hypothetical protein QAD02_014010 [Eretmocerus hayati]|uniref:Uncharacterized protein n=1 Tax=Eretmocerus hayati TaxID=131215 RepID=A0ACC2P547_9HYME|nr:hypothetical protein QAD02_014010 [Eretmocerus hayati]